MKSYKHVVLAIALPLMAVTSLAVSAHDNKAHDNRDGAACHGKHGQMKLDTDGDGKITQKEFMDSNAKRAEGRFAKLDANKDGVIDATEQQAWKDHMAKHKAGWNKGTSQPEAAPPANKTGA